MRSFVKIALFFIILGVFIGLILWLWTLQPQGPKIVSDIKKTISEPNTKEEDSTPKDGTILNTKITKFKGKMLPSSIVLILSNDNQAITKAQLDGGFEKDFNLSPGLNLIDIISISNDFAKEDKKSQTLYLAQDTSGGSRVLAGTVKTIFDNVLTLTTINGQGVLKTKDTTNIQLPKDLDDEEPSLQTQDIRIGDFAIGLGDLARDETLAAKSLTILRANKPQNTKQFEIVRILTTPKKNVFSANTLKNSKTLEFTLNKNSKVSIEDKEAKIEDIVKDKNAIIIYHPEGDKKVVDLILLLP